MIQDHLASQSTGTIVKPTYAELERRLGAARRFLITLRDRNVDKTDQDIWENVERSGVLRLTSELPMEEFDPARPATQKSIG